MRLRRPSSPPGDVAASGNAGSGLPAPPGLLARGPLAAVVADARARASRVVFTNGCFDLLHPGHVLYLAEASALGDLLVVGINSDESVRRLKGEFRPYLSAEARAVVLCGLRSVDYVTVFEEETPLALIEAITPDVLVKGGDWPVERIVGREWVVAHGGTVHALPFHPGFSSSSLAQRIRAAGA